MKFLPESINGTARELDWLRNMGDWMISKKRFWGLALPIWVNDEDPTDFEVIGSHEELKERAVEGWKEFDGHTPHRPWIDKVKIQNPKTGKLMSRIPDVGNPWLDAGIVAFSHDEVQQGPRVLEEVVPGRLHHRELPRPVPQLVLRAARAEHDDERRPAAVPDAARPRPRARPVRPRDAQERGELHRVHRRGRRGRRDQGPEGEGDPVQGDGRGRDALALRPAQPGREPELRPRPGGRGAEQGLLQAVEHLRDVLQLRASATGSTRPRRRCRSRSGRTSTAGCSRTCNCSSRTRSAALRELRRDGLRARSARSSSRAICRTGTCGGTRTGFNSKIADLDDAGLQGQVGRVPDALHDADDAVQADGPVRAVRHGGDVEEPAPAERTRRAFTCATSRSADESLVDDATVGRHGGGAAT